MNYEICGVVVEVLRSSRSGEKQLQRMMLQVDVNDGVN